MKKLALDDETLLSIQQPARYIGGEVNSVTKVLTPETIRFCMCFPDVYEIGMSHLGIQILYSMFNSREDIYCERVYSPWMDLDPIMREKNIPLFTLETQEPVKNFDFLGITLQYEMCYTNVLQILDLAQIPLHAADRGEDMPIVIGGGPCAYNPEPLADFFDMFYIGEGETVYFELLDCYKENKKNGGSRRAFLAKAAQIEGIYVPAFYDVEYNEDGTLKSFKPNCPTAKENAKLNHLEDTISFEVADVFDLLPNIKQNTYDFIILDPPAFTKSRKTVEHAKKGYKQINYRALKLLPRGGYLATCSCSHFMEDEKFVQMLKEAALEAGVSLRQIEARQQAPDHPILWNVPETDYLKFYIFQVI